MIYLLIIFAEVTILFFLSRKVHRLLGSIFYRLTRSKKLTVYLSAILFFPGTFVHEMSHFLAALFLLVPVGNMHLLPHIEENTNSLNKHELSIRMGSVAIGRTDPVRRFLIGIAPLVFGLSLVVTTIYFTSSSPGDQGGFLNSTYIDEFLTGYIVFTVANSMFSSKKDMEGSWVLLVLILFVIILIWILGININFRYLFSIPNWEVFKLTAGFMTIPVVFDIIAIIFLRKL